MSEHDHDLVLRRLRALTVLEPDSARSERTRRRCSAVLAARQPRGSSSPANSRFSAVSLGALVTLTAGLIVGMIQEAMRVYLRL